MAQLVNNPLAMRETWVLSLGWEDPLEKEMATHCSILAGEFHDYTVHGVTKSWTRLNNFHFHIYIYIYINIKYEINIFIIYKHVLEGRKLSNNDSSNIEHQSRG